MEILSTRRYTSDRDRLTVEILGSRFKGARRIFLASAYYDVPFCKSLLAHAPVDAKTVRLVFNGLGGARLVAQRSELADLEKGLRKRLGDVEVRLLFEPGVFHSKLLMIHGHRNQVAYVGSANATMAAMSINEEILLRVPGCAAIENYAERIWAASTPLSQLDDRLTARSLISFFRTGALYFKPTTSLQFTINPFTDLLATLPDVERTKLRTATLPHADQETGIGAFNLRRAAGLSDEAQDVTDREGMKAGIKPYAVETCLGYWVPRAVDGDLQRMLQKVGEGKRARLLELRRVLEKIGANTLARRYVEYVDAVHRLLIANDVAFGGFLAASRRNPFDPGAFRAFFKGVFARLQNEDYLGRLCLPFVSSVMPELWDDPRAFFEFESSFFEYLEYVAQRPGRKSRVPAAILTRIGFRTETPGVEQIKTTLEKYVATTGWTDKDW